MKEKAQDRQFIKMKIDALTWHARCLNQLTNNQVLDALTAFKNFVLPNDDATTRSGYIKMTDHGSTSMIQLAEIIKAESLQEKMTLNGPN